MALYYRFLFQQNCSQHHEILLTITRAMDLTSVSVPLVQKEDFYSHPHLEFGPTPLANGDFTANFGRFRPTL